jgi:hypothetical protein
MEISCVVREKKCAKICFCRVHDLPKKNYFPRLPCNSGSCLTLTASINHHALLTINMGIPKKNMAILKKKQ